MQIIHISIVSILQLGYLSHSIAAAGVKIKCSNIDEFYYTIPGSRCTTYYKCTAKGQNERKECNSGAMFDFYKQDCTRAPGNCYEPICIGRSNGIYQDTTHACRRAFTCYAGRITSIENCPAKQLHNGQKCVHQDLVSCDLPDNTAVAYPFSGDRRCVAKPDGHHAINGNCGEYLICQAGEVMDIGNCRNNYYFHADKRDCLPKQQVPHCQTLTSTSTSMVIDDFVCRNKRDGANADPTSIDCATYVLCRSGKLEAQKRCGIQAIFNGELCVPAPLYKCAPTNAASTAAAAALVDICHGKANGLYASPQQGCTSYVRCMSERSVEINECPVGHYFDAEARACIFERFLERRRCIDGGITLECDGKPDGYYRTPNDDSCQSYFYCHMGYKTQYKCSVGKLYNGERCVSKSHYTCPRADVDAFCEDRSDGYYHDPNDGCRSYHFCSEGRKITYLCAEGTTYDVLARKCVHNTSVTTCKSDHSCAAKSNGYHAELRSNCRNYVYCKNSEKITQLTCRDNNVFNGQKCVSPLEYACPSLYNHKQANCMPKQCGHQCERDGFYANIFADCREYYFCIGGKATKISCETGKRFNGELCVPEDMFSCPIFCRDHTHNNSCPLGGYVAL